MDDTLPAANGEPTGRNGTIDNPISPDGTPEIGRRYTVPARQGCAVRLAAGQVLKVINTHGTQVCDFWAFSAANLSEFLSLEHMRAWIDKVVPRPGDPMVTNRRRAILTLLEDTSPGIHDTLIAACDLFRYRTLGVEGYHDNCSDNLRLALRAIGERIPEIPAPLNLWMNIPVAADGTLTFEPTVARAGDHLLFRAEMPCIAAMSSCPQDLVPINGPDCMPVEVHFEVIS